jgi:YopT peptidase
MWLTRKFHYAMHAVVASKVPAVRASAVDAGGSCTYKFSQVENPVRSLICTNTETSGGICELVSAKWIEMRAKGGTLSAWLEGAGKPIDDNKIRQLMQLFAIGTTMSPGLMRDVGSETRKGGFKGDETDTGKQSQDIATKVFLQTNGVIRRVGTVKRNVSGVEMTFTNTPVETDDVGRGSKKRRVHAVSIANAIIENPNTYKTVAIRGSIFAHACAAYSAGTAEDGTVMWFDPNFGEFSFPSYASFVRWFPQFWHNAGYGTPAVGLSEEFKVREFVARA